MFQELRCIVSYAAVGSIMAVYERMVLLLDCGVGELGKMYCLGMSVGILYGRVMFFGLVLIVYYVLYIIGYFTYGYG